MKEVLRRLYKLQMVDSDIALLKKKLMDIPKKEHISDENVKTAEEVVKEIETELQKKEILREKREREMQETRMNLAKHKTQLLTAKTNREYSALLKEIGEEEKSIEKAEEETITSIMEIENLSEKLEEKNKELAEIRKRETSEKENLKKMQQELEVEIKQKTAKMEEIASHISISQLMTYERIQKGRGNAVATVKDDMCTGCNTLLPPQFVTLIRRGNKIYTCEECGRILVWHKDVE